MEKALRLIETKLHENDTLDERTRRLKIARIEMDPDNWKMAQDAVRDGGGPATEGPVRVYRREGSRRFVMGNGHHRAALALAKGETHIDAEIASEVLPRRRKS